MTIQDAKLLELPRFLDARGNLSFAVVNDASAVVVAQTYQKFAVRLVECLISASKKLLQSDDVWFSFHVFCFLRLLILIIIIQLFGVQSYMVSFDENRS